MSKNGMVKVVDFKDRAIERLGGYRDNPRALPRLVHARYAIAPSKHVGLKRVSGIDFALRKHKPHQMHTQHRDSCIKVMAWLIRKMDIRSRECVFVNPKYNIRRPVYVPEIARHTGLCDRTVTRCLGSLSRSRYLHRVANRFFLSITLFRDLSLDVTLERLAKQLIGIERRDQRQQAKAVSGNNGKQSAPNLATISQCEILHSSSPKVERSEASLALGNQFLSQLRRRRPKPPPE